MGDIEIRDALVRAFEGEVHEGGDFPHFSLYPVPPHDGNFVFPAIRFIISPSTSRVEMLGGEALVGVTLTVDLGFRAKDTAVLVNGRYVREEDLVILLAQRFRRQYENVRWPALIYEDDVAITPHYPEEAGEDRFGFTANINIIYKE